MAKAVTLSSASMSNLLSLQNTQSLVDRTQGRLSTGKAVNSALDDAMAFFKNRNLTNRASDLADIKKDIQNGVNVIKEAVDSLEQIDSLLKNAKAAAQSVKAEKDADVRKNYIKQINDTLEQIVQLAADSNYDGINLIQNVKDVGLDTDAGEAAKAKLAAGSTLTEADLTNEKRTEYAGKAFDAALAEKGEALFEKGTGAKEIKVKAQSDYGTKDVTLTDALDESSKLENIEAWDSGAVGKVKKHTDGNYYLVTEAKKGTKVDTAALKNELVSKANAASGGSLDANSALVGKEKVKNLVSGGGTDTRDLQTRVNEEVANNREAYQDKNGYVAPERLTVIFSEQDRDRKIDVNAKSLSSLLTGLVNGNGAKEITVDDWHKPQVAGDVNGPKVVDTDKIDAFIASVEKARKQVQAYSAELGNYSSIMSTRSEWTDNTINTLKGGGADLVNANMNEESANMLALQTRQQLGVIALSIAQQSEQAVLRLF
ncbi:hypothetical protein IHV25_04510 [Phaeovibrio sulfidiphilus]|uniref:Flagellin n=1 Tax=Phaeovibrio sulfidiphilus TaxID=1220600 RepID=A0A8J6YYK3_9PROT|nr:flagellin [Phaeovibrio sulfidiphilus]MBE1236908.1 hypothetical protein [Phaeovibrio sulfidiphilus]